MKVRYYDAIDAKGFVDIEVNSKIVHFLEKDKEKRDKLKEKEAKIGFVSLDELMANGFQPSTYRTLEEEIIRRYNEEKYLNSHEYKQFRRELNYAIINKMDKMSKHVRMAMFLRFFKGFSILQIAKVLGVKKPTAQTYLARGCKYIKDFLERDIAEQNRKEIQERYEKYGKNS